MARYVSAMTSSLSVMLLIGVAIFLFTILDRGVEDVNNNLTICCFYGCRLIREDSCRDYEKLYI